MATTLGRSMNRRSLLQLGLMAGTTTFLAGCSTSVARANFVAPTAKVVSTTEAGRYSTGKLTQTTLVAAPTVLDLGGRTAATWAYQGASAAEPIRANVGDRLQVVLDNQLPDPTSIHWHGLALRNDMDGVPPLTQQPVAPGARFEYSFTLPHPGTYWFHPHVGAQLDRGLHAPLIIDDPSEPADYTQEWVLVLDDWLDGVSATPDDVAAELGRGMGGDDGAEMDSMDSMDPTNSGTAGASPMQMGNTLMGATSDLLGGDAGDVYYPLYLINGRSPLDPQTFTTRPGERIRLRIINAAADTAFRFGVNDHPLTITHTDGFPVRPVSAESVVVGMGERYDALITTGEGVFTVIAEALGKQAQAVALLRTSPGAAGSTTAKLPRTSTPLTAAALQAAPEVSLAQRASDRTLTLELTGSMATYDWGINGRRMDMNQPLAGALGIQEGERVTLELKNSTSMWHPMHLHGHTYQHADGGPRKDTSIVLPGQTLRVAFDADNPGRWLVHCHNLYHGEAGMMTAVAYEAP